MKTKGRLMKCNVTKNVFAILLCPTYDINFKALLMRASYDELRTASNMLTNDEYERKRLIKAEMGQR